MSDDTSIPERQTAEGAPDSGAGEEGGNRKLSPRAKRNLIIAAVLIAVLGAGWFVYNRLYGRYFQETNDAQIDADAIIIAPRTAGYVAEVLVADNQDVVAGQPLVRMDARDIRAKSAQAEAQVAVAEASADNVRASILEQRAAIDQASAQLAAARSKARFDAAEVARYTPLAASGAEPREKLSQLRQAAEQSAQQASAQAAALAAQQRRIGSLEAQVRQSEAQARQGKAQLTSADVDVQAALIRAPLAGRVGDKTVTVGQYAQIGTRLMSVVPLSQMYIVANFKETQIGLMRPGQPATVKVDALDGTELHGRVVSISPGTGAQFSLLPPQNATGNFTKIVQRVPVRIALQMGPETRRLLVPGLSVTVTVDTRSAEGAEARIDDEQQRLDAKKAG